MIRESVFIVAIVSCLAVVLPVETAWSGQDSFEITDYIPQKFEDLMWRLSGGFHLAGRSANSHAGYPFDAWMDMTESEHDGSWMNLNAYTDVRYDYETVPQFLNFSLSLAGSSYRNNSTSSSTEIDVVEPFLRRLTMTENSRCSYGIGLAPSVDAGKYLAKDFFLSFLLDARINYNKTPRNDTESRSDLSTFHNGDCSLFKDNSTTDRESETRDYSILVDVMPGWGRVYEGWYASTAMYMIEELRSHDALLREPSRNQMLALSEIVHRNRLQHAVDYRIRRIETFHEILGYLRGTGLIDLDNHYGYLLIQDVWNYFPRDRRRFGMKARLGTGAQYRRRSRQSTTDTYTYRFQTRYHVDSASVVDTLIDKYYYSYRYTHWKSQSRELYLTGLLECFNPLTRHWQVDFAAQAWYYYDTYTKHWDTDVSYTSYTDMLHSKTGYKRDTDFEKYYSFSLSATATCILDSRTSFGFRGDYDYQRLRCIETKTYEDDRADTEITYDRSDWAFKLGANLIYRISIPTTLHARASYMRKNGSTEYDRSVFHDSDSYSVLISLAHYIY